MNRDTTSAAVGIEITHYGRWNVYEALYSGHRRIDHEYEIHTYDVAHRVGPRRILRWDLRDAESPWIVGWDDSGLVVARGPIDDMVPLRVDPVTGASRPLAFVPTPSLKAWSRRLNHDDRLRMQVVRRDDGFYLWIPRTRRWEFLFQQPIVPEKPADAPAADMAVRDRYADSIHRIWQVSTRQEADSVRFIIDTYVPRPGTGARLYFVSLYMDLPDTSRIDANRRFPLGKRGIRVGSASTTLEFAISNGQLREMIIPYRHLMHRPTWSKAIETRVEIQLKPVRLPGDENRLPPAYWTTSSESAEVAIPVPGDWLTASP